MERAQKTNFACLIAASLCFAAALAAATGPCSALAVPALHWACRRLQGKKVAARADSSPSVCGRRCGVVVFLQAIGMYDTPLWRLVGAVAGTALGL